MNKTPCEAMEKPIVIGFKLIGLLPLFLDTKKAKLYSTGVFMFIYIGFISVTWSLTDMEGHFGVLSEKFYLAAVVQMITLGYTALLKKEEVLVNLLTFLRAPLEKEYFKFEFTIEQVEWYSQYQQFCRKVNYVIVWSYLIFIYVTVAIVVPAVKLTQGNDLEKTLPLPYPFTIHDYKMYALLFGVIMIAVILLVTCAATLPALYVNVVLMLHAHCYLLSQSLDQIEQRTRDILYAVSTPQNHSLILRFSSSNVLLEKISLKYLHGCIKWHQQLRSACNDLQELTNIFISPYLFVSCVVVVCNCLVLTQGAGTFLERSPISFQLLTALANVYVFCWMGEFLSSSSSNIRVSAYNSFWLSRSKPYKTSFKIFMEATKRPFTLKTHFCKINLDTFTHIMATLYSYFNALKQINRNVDH